MAYKHGVYVSEIPTALVAPRVCDTAIPFVVGTAPIHLSDTGLENTGKQVHYPILANNYEEAVKKLGYSDDWKNYTLCEFIYAAFQIYNYAPIVLVNVLDPEIHRSKVEEKEYTIEEDQTVLGEDVILDTVIVKAEVYDDQTASNQETVLDAGADYTLGWNAKREAVLNVVDGGRLAGKSTAKIEFYVIDPSLVTKADIIGGYNSITKRNEGLALIDSVFPKFGKVALHIAAPGWSHLPEVAAVMTAKCHGISGLFPAITFTDIPSDEISGVTEYTEANEWKRKKSYTNGSQYAMWPLAALGDRAFHISTVACGVTALTDAEYNDIPYASPSNHLSKMTGAVLADGTELLLDINGANLLNENGIATLFNWESGWMLWGNEMGCYPSNTDPKDRFINIRRFFNWYAVHLILTWFQKVDRPINRRLLETIENTENQYLNSLVTQGALVGSNNRVEFRAEDNPEVNLIDGVIKAHIYLTVPPPARDIEFALEYNTENLLELFL